MDSLSAATPSSTNSFSASSRSVRERLIDSSASEMLPIALTITASVKSVPFFTSDNTSVIAPTRLSNISSCCCRWRSVKLDVSALSKRLLTADVNSLSRASKSRSTTSAPVEFKLKCWINLTSLRMFIRMRVTNVLISL